MAPHSGCSALSLRSSRLSSASLLHAGAQDVQRGAAPARRAYQPCRRGLQSEQPRRANARVFPLPRFAKNMTSESVPIAPRIMAAATHIAMTASCSTLLACARNDRFRRFPHRTCLDSAGYVVQNEVSVDVSGVVPKNIEPERPLRACSLVANRMARRCFARPYRVRAVEGLMLRSVAASASVRLSQCTSMTSSRSVGRSS